jgi:parvulin-like peptidyl-prolyl isomerase
MKSNFLKGSFVVTAMLLLSSYSYANNELESFSMIKYKTQYSALNDEQKKKLTQEYDNIKKISTKLQEKEMKDNPDLKVATNMSTFRIWSSDFMKKYNPSNTELENLFKSQKPTLLPTYTLRNILVQDEKTADSLLKSLAIKDKKKQKEAFIKAVKEKSFDLASVQKEGLLESVNASKLHPNIQKALKDKKVQDVVKVQMPKNNWQVILIEDFKASKNATFEESKPALIKLAKQQALNKEIEKILK